MDHDAQRRGSLIMGTVYNFETDASSWTKASGILGNVSNLVAPFLAEPIVSASDDSAAVLKLAIDMIANLGTSYTILGGS